MIILFDNLDSVKINLSCASKIIVMVNPISIRLFNAYQLKKEHTLQMDTYTFFYKKLFLLI